MFKSISRPRSWGFRFFASDAALIGVFGAAAVVLQRLENPLWWLLIVVAGHFFLFCNVFRLRRSYELSWSAAFLLNAAVWLWFGLLEWPRVLAVQLPITVGLLIAELRSDRYHGILARRLNHRLNDYLEGRIL